LNFVEDYQLADLFIQIKVRLDHDLSVSIPLEAALYCWALF